MKKFLATLICFQMLALPAMAGYDFSDEAQAEFDKNKGVQVNKESTPIKNNFSRSKQKREQLQDVNSNDDNDRRHYEPSPLLYEQPQQTQQNRTLYGSVVTIPAGTSFSVTFDSGINSGSLEQNDRLATRLTNDLIYNGKLIATAGSLVYGSARYAKNAGYAYGGAEIEINFDEIMLSDGTLLKISTENIYMKTDSERAKKMTRDIVVGALGSMLIGAMFTALGGGDNWGKNMLVYGGIGAVGGGVRGAFQRGKEVDIPNGTTIQIRLTQPLRAQGN